MNDVGTIKVVTIRLKGLPPDPDGANAARAAPAGSAVYTYKHEKGMNADEDGLFDLLVDLRHWADREGLDFDDAIEHSKACYVEETTPAP